MVYVRLLSDLPEVGIHKQIDLLCQTAMQLANRVRLSLKLKMGCCIGLSLSYESENNFPDLHYPASLMKSRD